MRERAAAKKGGVQNKNKGQYGKAGHGGAVVLSDLTKNADAFELVGAAMAVVRIARAAASVDLIFMSISPMLVAPEAPA
ncbi:MAG: hypothetical protein AAFU65_09750, partial [Pseudomonadota bacterium]